MEFSYSDVPINFEQEVWVWEMVFLPLHSTVGPETVKDTHLLVNPEDTARQPRE